MKRVLLNYWDPKKSGGYIVWAGILFIALILFMVTRMMYLDGRDHPEDREDSKLFWSEMAEIFWIKTKNKENDNG